MYIGYPHQGNGTDIHVKAKVGTLVPAGIKIKVKHEINMIRT